MPDVLTEESYERLLEHYSRHSDENGAGGFWFMQPGQAQCIGYEAFHKPLSELGWARLWTLEYDGHVRAHVMLIGNGVSAHRATLSMGVEGPIRGAGIGRKLMTLAVSWAAAQSQLCFLDGWALAHNTPVLKLDYSVGWYETGFIEDALRIDGLKMDQILLTLRLR